MPTPVQVGHNTTTGATSVTVTLGAASTPGNTMVAVIWAGAASISGVTLGGSSSGWASRALINPSGVGPVAIWSSPGFAAASTSVVVTQASSSTMAVFVYELTGNCTLDQAGAGHGQNDGAAGFTSGTTGTTTSANEYWIAVVAGYDGSGAPVTMTTPPSAPWVNQSIVNFDTFAYLYTSYQLTTSTGTPSYSGTASPASGVNSYGCIIATFVQPASGVAGSAPLTAGGTMTAGATEGPQGAAPLTAGGTMTAGGQLAGGAPLTAAGTMAAGAAQTQPGAAPLTAGGTMTAGAAEGPQGAAPLAAGGTMVAGGTITQQAAATLVAVGTMQALAAGAGAAPLAAGGTMVAGGTITQQGAATLTAAGTMNATPGANLQGAATLVATGTMRANPPGPPASPGAPLVPDDGKPYHKKIWW